MAARWRDLGGIPLWALIRGAYRRDGESRIEALVKPDGAYRPPSPKYSVGVETLERFVRRNRVLAADVDSLISEISKRYHVRFPEHFRYTAPMTGLLTLDANGHLSATGIARPWDDSEHAQVIRRAANARDAEIAKPVIGKQIAAMPRDVREACILTIELKGVLDGQARIRR